MAASLMGGGSRGGNGRYSRRRSYVPMSEINVPPMVDVMLVLLIIFMVTAPLLTVGVPVELPQTQAEVLSDPDEPTAITVKPTGPIVLPAPLVTHEALAPRLVPIPTTH